MAQTRLRDYKDDLGSFEHNLFNLGVHGPGRFAGFDTLISTGNVGNTREFEIRHTGTGFSYKNAINNVIGPIGVVMTPQGVLIQESAPIGPLAPDTNAGNALTRYDLVYLTHDYVVADGGQAATYGIIKGAVGVSIKPILADPLKQVAIGIIELPPNASNAAEFIWHKSKSPDSGDGEDARLTYPNSFKKTQSQNKSERIYDNPTESGVFNAITANFWDFDNDGNVYTIQANAGRYIDGIKIHDVPIQEGMRIHVMVLDNTLLRENPAWLADPIASKGYKAIRIPPGLGNENIGNALGGSPWGVRPAAGEEWELELLFYKDRWTLLKIGGAGVKSPHVRGDLKDIWGVDIGLNFSSTGVGKNLHAGWAICNGLNGTPDLRGKSRYMATTDVPAPGMTPLEDEAATLAAGANPEEFRYGIPYTISGSRSIRISQAQLPDVIFPVNDPGHRHGVPLTAGSDSGGGGVTSGAVTGNDGAPLTNIAYTGITVSSGGAGEPIHHYTPAGAVLTLMKL